MERRTTFGDLPMSSAPMIWIAYTTEYRDGGHQIAMAAHTMARRYQATRSEVVRCEAVESKASFLEKVQALSEEGFALREQTSGSAVRPNVRYRCGPSS